MFRVSVLLLGLLSLASVGCLHKQVARDGIGSRQAILDVYTDQIMDNLIRAKTCQPFVQLQYRDLSVQDLDTVGGGFDDTLTAGTNQTLVGAVVTGMTRSWSNAFKFNGSGRRDRTISFKADPVTDENEVYEYYMAFALDPTLFVESDTKPQCDVHIMRKCGKRYFYVPCEAAGVFQQLCLKTTFMRGQSAKAAPEHYECTIRQLLVGDPDANGDVRGQVVFDRVIPNDKGYALVTLTDKRQVRVELKHLTVKPAGAADLPAHNGDTTSLDIVYNEKKILATKLQIEGGKAKVYLENNRPAPPPAPVDLKRLNDNLDTIRLNLLNQSNR